MFYKKLPSDRVILKTIYEMYAQEYYDLNEKNPDDKDKLVLIPIDLKVISDKLGISVHQLFGRFYYHLNTVYSHHDNKAELFVAFSQKHAGQKCVNFPYLCGILSQLEADFYNRILTLIIAGLALVVSIVSLGFTLYTYSPK